MATDVNILAICLAPGSGTNVLYSVLNRTYAGIPTQALLDELRNRGIEIAACGDDLFASFTELTPL